MNFFKVHYKVSLLTLVILLVVLFILGETSWKTTFIEVTQSLPQTTQTAAVSDFNSNLILHYTFDDGTATDQSGKGNNGVFRGMPIPVAGKVGSGALILENRAYIDIGNHSTFNYGSTKDFTWSVWFKGGTLDCGGTISPILISKGFVNRESHIKLDIDQCTFNRVNGFSGVQGSWATSVNSGYTGILDGQWHHIVFSSKRASSMELYIDGVKKGSSGPTDTLDITNTDSLLIGAGTQNGYGINGYLSSIPSATIDDVRIYNRDLTPSEITDLYNLGSGTPPPVSDTTPPSSPTSLTSSNITQTGATISWSPSTDTVGVTGYRIYRDTTQITTVSGTAHTDTTLTPATTYNYTISAYDAAGNISTPSQPLSIRTLDSTITPTNGTCGPAAKTYTPTESFPQGSYCSSGTPSPSSPTNPTSDSTSSWICEGSNGGSNSLTCTAHRNAPVVTGSLITAASCSQTDVQRALDTAQDLSTVLIPAGSCTWTSRVSLDARSRSIILRGSGVDKTAITTLVSPALTITGSQGKAFVVSDLKFIGGVDNTIIQIYGDSKQWRIHHLLFSTSGGPVRLFNIQGQTYGVIDHNTVIGTTPSEFVTVENNQLSAGDGGWVSSWQKPVILGDANAVYIEDNTVSWSGRWEGRPFIDGAIGGRAVVRYNTITNANFGNHGFDSGYGASMLRLEVYHNTVTLTDAMETWGRLGLVRGGTGVWFGNTFVLGPKLWGSNKIYLSIFRNFSGSAATWPVCNGTQYLMCSNIDKNWKLLDGTWSPKVATSDLQCAGSTIPGGSNAKSYTAKWKFCSVSRMTLCTTDSDCPGGEVCNAYLDGPTSQKGYPCFQQPGRGYQNQLAPLYEWNNTMSGSSNVRTSDVDFYPENSQIMEGRDFFNDTVMPGYTPYTYPHPLTTSGFTGDDPTKPPPPPTTCTSFTYSTWGSCTNGTQSRTILTSSPTGCTGGTPILTQSCSLTTLTADFNSDGSVNTLDFSSMSTYWNRSSTIHDLNKDGIVNTLDYSILVQNWTG